jgi:hypothetical protein
MKCQGEIFGHSLFVDARARRFSRQDLQGLHGVFSLCPGDVGTAALRALIRRVTLMIIMVNEFSGFLTDPSAALSRRLGPCCRPPVNAKKARFIRDMAGLTMRQCSKKTLTNCWFYN